MKSSPPTTVSPAPTTTAAAGTSTMGKTVVTNATPATTGVFAYTTHPHQAHMTTISQPSSGYSGSPLTTPNPYAALTQSHWGMHSVMQSKPNASPPSANTVSVSLPLVPTTPTTTPTPGPSSQPPQVQAQPAQAPDVIIPIILGPIPATHADYSPTHPNNSVKEGYMVLHERTLILDPDVFSGLTKERLAEVEKMGMRAALGLLTTHMVKALKERRAKERGKGRERGTRRVRSKGKRGGSAATTGGPFTHAPLERRPMGASTDVSGGTGIGGNSGGDIVQTKPPTPVVILVPDPVPMDVSGDGQGEVGSPIVIVDDSDDEGPAAKRRKVEAVVG
jgi:forkhead box protein K